MPRHVPRVVLLLSAVLLLVPASVVRAAEEPPGGWSAMERDLRLAVREGKVKEARAILSELSRTNETRGYEIMIDAGLDTEDPEIYGYAAGLLARLEGKDREVLFKSYPKCRLASTRIVLLAVAARWKDDERAINLIHDGLSDTAKPVVFSALRWVRELRKPEVSIPRLIDELSRRERGPRNRVYFDLVQTLTDLTGQKHELASDWKKAVGTESRGGDAPARARPTGGGRTVVRLPSFFSVAVESDRVVFLIDTSGSMDETDPIPQKEPEFIGDGTTVVRIPREAGSDGKPTERTRLSAVQSELIQAVRGLDSSVRFNIIAFSHEIRWFDRSRGGAPIEATAENKTRAETWVRELRSDGATRTDLALREALALADVDTIILLSDGAPRSEANQAIDPRSIYALVDQLNRFRKTRIHTIGFLRAGTSMRTFLRELSKANDGKTILLE